MGSVHRRALVARHGNHGQLGLVQHQRMPAQPGGFDTVSQQLLMPFDNPAKTAIVADMLVRNGNLKPGESVPSGGNQTAIK